MNDHPPPLLSVEELSFRYPETSGGASVVDPARARVPVLDRLTFEVPVGGRTVLLGRADAGKTTLARIIAGLVPRFTGGGIAGEILIQGRHTRPVPPYELLQTVGLVAQDSDEQLFTTRCDTEAAFALESMGLPRAEMRRRVRESLEQVGLADLSHRNPATLSGGEKKRLLVACLLAVRPALWLLDEAMGELDFEWKERILGLVSSAAEAMLIMESRWSPLAERWGRAFLLLERGTLRASAAEAGDPALAAALGSAGIRPSLGMAPRAADRDGRLCVEQLRFRFPGEGAFGLAIDHLEIGFGEICALVGRNGSGKSTLARLLCGLVRPQEGVISFQGAGGGASASPFELGSRVGYLFQNPDHQIFLPTVREELALGLRSLRLSGAELQRRVGEAARQFDLPDLEAPPALLSYGARRRLQAATYFLLSRDLLILDEIDSGLSYGEVERLVRSLASRVPGLVLITHDLVLARAVSHRILAMDKGRILRDGPSEELDPGSLDALGER